MPASASRMPRLYLTGIKNSQRLALTSPSSALCPKTSNTSPTHTQQKERHIITGPLQSSAGEPLVQTCGPVGPSGQLTLKKPPHSSRRSPGPQSPGTWPQGSSAHCSPCPPQPPPVALPQGQLQLSTCPSQHSRSAGVPAPARPRKQIKLYTLAVRFMLMQKNSYCRSHTYTHTLPHTIPAAQPQSRYDRPTLGRLELHSRDSQGPLAATGEEESVFHWAAKVGPPWPDAQRPVSWGSCQITWCKT